MQKDSQSPFIQTPHGHPGFTPQKVGKSAAVSFLFIKTFLGFRMFGS